MIVCIGHSVSIRDIPHAARQGCNSLTALQQQSRFASVCSAWRECAGQSQWTSDQLPGNSNDIQVTHGDSIELLRLTSFGKLILTK